MSDRLTIRDLYNGQAEICRAKHYDGLPRAASVSVVRFHGTPPSRLKRWVLVKHLGDELEILCQASTCNSLVARYLIDVKGCPGPELVR